MRRPAVVFVDWHGVLSHDMFWHNIRTKPAHPLYAPVSNYSNKLFHGDKNHRLQPWLRGQITSRQMCTDLTHTERLAIPADALQRQLYCGIAAMRYDEILWQTLRAKYPTSLIVIASDNIDEFSAVYRDTRVSYLRYFKQLAPVMGKTFRSLSLMADGLICSADRGVLKAEDPLGFFGPFLGELGVGFEETMLIDDNAENCAAFLHAGGYPKLWKPDHSVIWQKQGIVKPMAMD